MRRIGFALAVMTIITSGGLESWATATPDIIQPRTISLDAYGRVGDEIDLGAPGVSAGDELIYSGVLDKANTSIQVGTFEAVCVITHAKTAIGQCSMTAKLKGGQLTTQGHSRSIPWSTFTNAVTGGTGLFGNVRGQVDGTSETPVITHLVYEITP